MIISFHMQYLCVNNKLKEVDIFFVCAQSDFFW